MSSNDIIYQSKGALISFLVSEGFQTGSDTGNITGSALENEIAVWSNPTTIEGDANFTWDNTLRVTGAFFVSGDTTLGDASGDSVTINAETIVLSNVDTGTDNTVLVYDGSSIVTDEIDSKVWAGDLVDYTGTPVNNQVAIWTDTDTLEGDSDLTFDGTELTLGSAIDLDVGKDLQVRGNTTLGNASGDNVTINAMTIDLANVGAGTDNTVLVYNGSSIVTDEIDSKVWAGKLIDYTGTPVDSQLGVWTDTDTLEGDANLTFDGTLRVTGSFLASGDTTFGSDITVGGDLTVTGDEITLGAATSYIKDSGGDNRIKIDANYIYLLDNGGNSEFYVTDGECKVYNDFLVDGNTTLGNASSDLHTINGYLILPNGLSSSMGTAISSAANTTAANYWIKVAECRCNTVYARASATIDVMLSGYETTAELYQARAYVSYFAAGVATCQVEIIQDAGSEAWDTSDFILTYNSTSDMAQLWVRDPARYQRCYATITNGSSDGNLNYKSDWYLKTGQAWASSYTSLGAVATTTIAQKVQEDWIGLTFNSYWQDYDNTADYEDGAYMIDSLGFVHVRGLVETTSTSAGIEIAQLPVGYRPLKHCVFTQYSADGAVRVDVKSTGDVSVITGFTDGNNEWLSLAGITFRAGT